MSLYVTIEPRTLREAEERAEADACSAVVAVHRESAEQRRTREFWARHAPQPLPSTRKLALVRSR
jgi:hypothetical protein